MLYNKTYTNIIERNILMRFKQHAVRKALAGDMRYLDALQSGVINVELLEGMLMPVNNKEVNSIVDDPKAYLANATKMRFESISSDAVQVTGTVDDVALSVVSALTELPIDHLLTEQIETQIKTLSGNREITISQLQYDGINLPALQEFIPESVEGNVEVAATLEPNKMIETPEEHEMIVEDYDTIEEGVFEEPMTEEINEPVIVEDPVIVEESPQSTHPEVLAAIQDIFNTLKQGVKQRGLDKSLQITI